MKPYEANSFHPTSIESFSALGRAVWDETERTQSVHRQRRHLSVLSVEPYGMKLDGYMPLDAILGAFSALGRAVWDETRHECRHRGGCNHLSVLSVEPYGMKRAMSSSYLSSISSFSALGRAVWDETSATAPGCGSQTLFQCSRSSRMG